MYRIKWEGPGWYWYDKVLDCWRPVDMANWPPAVLLFAHIPDGWEDVSDPEVKQQAAEEAARRAGRD